MPPAGSSRCPYCAGVPADAFLAPYGAVDCAVCSRRIWQFELRGESVFLEYAHADLLRAFLDSGMLADAWHASYAMSDADIARYCEQLDQELRAAMAGQSPSRSFRCPHCAADPAVDHEAPLGSVDCAGCGKRLWYLQQAKRQIFFKYDDALVFESMLNYADLAGEWSVPGAADSLDKVEYVMEIEEEIDVVLGRGR